MLDALPASPTSSASCSSIPGARDVFPEWRVAADEQVGRLRRATTRWERDDAVAELVDELRRAPEFEIRWDAHPVDEKRRGTKLIAHPTAGDLVLDFEVLALADDSGQQLITWLASGTGSAEHVEALIGPPRLRLVEGG